MKPHHWLAAFLTLCAPSLWAAAERADADKFTLNFANVDLPSVLKLASQLTGRHFVLDPRVRGTVNIVAAEPMPKAMIYPTLVAALRLQGIAAIDDGKTVRVLPEADARGQGAPVISQAQPGDSLATQIFPLRFESALALSSAIKPLLSANATAQAYAGNNSLVVTDFSANLRRLAIVLQAIDVPALDEPQVVPLRYANAAELAGVLQNLIGDGANAPAGERLVVLAEPHSNSLLLRSHSPARVQRAV
jgi:general secretion pathway protein D